MLFNILSFASVMQTVGSVLVAILILLATITVHEFGHYIVGKLFGFKINEFAIGMGPAIFKKVKKNGEIFSIRIFPLGGFCAFEGEDEDDESSKSDKKDKEKADETKGESEEKPENESTDESKKENTKPTFSASNGFSVVQTEKKPLSENAFNNKKPWQRILVLLAGATMNFIAAILVIVLNFGIFGHFQLSAAEVKKPIAGETINAETTLLDGDVITEIDGKFIYLTTDISSALNGKKAGDEVKLRVKRGDEFKNVTVSLKSDVNITSLSDYFPAFEALNIATVLSVDTDVWSVIPKGAYLFRFADSEEYSDCTRIYDTQVLYERLKTLAVGESVEIYYSTDGQTHNKLKLTAGDNYDTVNKDEKKEVLNHFGIKGAGLSYQLASVNVRMNFFEVLYRSPVYAFKTVGVTFRSFGELLTGKLSISSMSGPIGTIAITSQQVSRGFDYVLEMAALIGISVAVFNVLPIPALDGARAVFVLIEWIRKKPINRNVEAMIHFVGLIVLIGFAVFVDVIKLFI